MAALDDQKAKHGQVAGVIGQGVSAVGRFGAAMLGLQGVQQIISTISDAFAKVRMDALKSAEAVATMRGDLLSLQALRGQTGNTGPGISHVFDIAKETLQDTADVKAMEEAGRGIGELAIGPKGSMTSAEFDKAMIAAGKASVLERMEPGAAGQMMGQIALQAKGHLSPEEAEGRFNKLLEIQRPGGFRNATQFSQQYAKMAPLVQNDVLSQEQAAGLLSGMSVVSPDEAATLSQQFVRATMGGRLRARGSNLAPDVDNENTATYLKGIGADKETNPLAIGKLIAADIAKQQAAAAKAGTNFSTHDYLMTRGFSNQEERTAIMAFTGMQNSGRLAKIDEAAGAPLDNGAISRRFSERLQRDNYLKGRQIDLADQAATIKQGLDEEPLVLAQHAAFARLKAQGKISGDFAEWQRIERGGLSGATEGGIQDMFKGNYHSQVTREMMHSLEAERKRLGVEAPGVFGSGSAHEYELRYAKAIQAGGGDVTRGVSEDLQAAAKSIRNATEAMERHVGRNPVPEPMPAKPPAQATRVP